MTGFLFFFFPSFLALVRHLKYVGYGSSAVVYDAYYKPLNKRVAVKVIDLDMFERNQIDELRRETQVMALCKHPNVLRVSGAFVKDSKLYIVTPYLSAGKSDSTFHMQTLKNRSILHHAFAPLLSTVLLVRMKMGCCMASITQDLCTMNRIMSGHHKDSVSRRAG